ncbi:putative transporter SVOPL isoform X2 [Belonocnema kinseyi]|uniref:putative transporter SVOPL isoform X2 n=1 Tax=Belonocnema kinseyi TaxID=2817044 RepID=UPI00143D05DA|nr:putative transporter SVOPL isoform X2 [Belonocnema kinseyi]
MSGECESAITKTGWGLCNFSVITLCGICMIAEAGASIIILIVSPLLNCDLKFESNSVTEMNATVSLGMAFGGFTFGTLVDMNGRKESIPVAMIVIFCGSIGLAFAHTYFLVNLMIFVLGIGVAGTNLIFRIYMIECLPARKRGSCLAVLDFCWIAGYVIFLGICGAMTPSAIELQGNDFRPISWRVMSGLGAAPILVMACAMSLLPPSPRFLLYKRHPEQAISVLRQMFAINFSRHADKYPVTIRSLEGCIEVDEDEEPNANKSIRKLIHKYLSKSLKRMKKILTPPCLRVTILCILACCFHFPGIIRVNWKYSLSSLHLYYSPRHKERFVHMFLIIFRHKLHDSDNNNIGKLPHWPERHDYGFLKNSSTPGWVLHENPYEAPLPTDTLHCIWHNDRCYNCSDSSSRFDKSSNERMKSRISK